MTLIRDILGIKKEDLDDLAYDQLEGMILELVSLRDNFTHLSLLLENIRKNRKEGKKVKEAVRENVLATLHNVRKQLIDELRKEEVAEKLEATQKQKEKKSRGRRGGLYNAIGRNELEKRGINNEFLIGSSSECDLIIADLPERLVGLCSSGEWQGSIGIMILQLDYTSSYSEIWIKRENLVPEKVIGTKVIYDRNFTLYIERGAKRVATVKIVS